MLGICRPFPRARPARAPLPGSFHLLKASRVPMPPRRAPGSRLAGLLGPVALKASASAPLQDLLQAGPQALHPGGLSVLLQASASPNSGAGRAKEALAHPVPLGPPGNQATGQIGRRRALPRAQQGKGVGAPSVLGRAPNGLASTLSARAQVSIAPGRVLSALAAVRPLAAGRVRSAPQEPGRHGTRPAARIGPPTSALLLRSANPPISKTAGRVSPPGCASSLKSAGPSSAGLRSARNARSASWAAPTLAPSRPFRSEGGLSRPFTTSTGKPRAGGARPSSKPRPSGGSSTTAGWKGGKPGAGGPRSYGGPGKSSSGPRSKPGGSSKPSYRAKPSGSGSRPGGPPGGKKRR